MGNDTSGGSETKLPHNTPRQTALEKNDASNFEKGPPYDIKGGHPITKDMPSQEYKSMPMKPASEGSKPLDIPAPFTIKGA